MPGEGYINNGENKKRIEILIFGQKGVDVTVHLTCSEMKFSNRDLVFGAVVAMRGALVIINFK